jgi:hypothetical protein
MLETFLEGSLRDLFRNGAAMFVAGEVLLLCEASSAYTGVFHRGAMSGGHGCSQKRLRMTSGNECHGVTRRDDQG